MELWGSSYEETLVPPTFVPRASQLAPASGTYPVLRELPAFSETWVAVNLNPSGFQCVAAIWEQNCRPRPPSLLSGPHLLAGEGWERSHGFAPSPHTSHSRFQLPWQTLPSYPESPSALSGRSL